MPNSRLTLSTWHEEHALVSEQIRVMNQMISQITVKPVQTSQSLEAHTTEICLSLDIFQRWFLARNRNPLVSTMSLYLHHFYLDEKSFLGPTLSLLQPQAKHPRLIFSLFKSFLFHRVSKTWYWNKLCHVWRISLLWNSRSLTALDTRVRGVWGTCPPVRA